MRTLVLLNPGAGSAGDREALQEALSTLDKVKVVRTRGGRHAREAARRAPARGFRRVVAAGGDGTVNQVLNGLVRAEREAVLGVLPLGTANDFARSLALPQELAGAVEVLRGGATRRIDLGEVRRNGSTAFVNVVVGGFGGRVSEHVDASRKRALGPLEYLRSAAEELPDLQTHRIRMEVGEERLETLGYHVVVANGGRSGGNLPLAPRARLDDGLLDIVLIPALGIPELLLLAPKIVLGRHLEDERVVYRRAASVAFTSEPPMRFNADGEPIGSDPLEFRLRPKALTVAAPPPRE